MKSFEEWWKKEMWEAQLSGIPFATPLGAAKAGWQACAAEYQPQLDKLAEAARFLANEVAACTGMDEAEMRQLLGNTNFNCLIRRMNEVRELLAVLDRSGARGGSVAGQSEASSGNPPTNEDRSRT